MFFFAIVVHSIIHQLESHTELRTEFNHCLFLFGIWVPTIFFAVFASYLREPITDRRIFQWLLGGLVVAGIGAEAYGQALAGIERELDILRRGRVESGEIAAARKLLRTYLLGMGEDRDAHFRYRFRGALVGIDKTPEEMWTAVGYVEGEDLARVARGLKSDTVYMVHGGMRAGVAV